MPCDANGVTTIPYDSNGNFSLPAGSIVATGQKVLPSQHNPPLQDIATNGLSNVMTRDGRGPMTANLPMGGNKITGMADGTAATDAATVGQAASAIGDFKSSVRLLDSKWLRRNGGIYAIADYPDLAAILPPLPDGITWTDVPHSMTSFIWGDIFGSEFYVICAGSGSVLVYKSTDFQNFTLQATISGINGFRIYKFGSTLVITGANNSGNVLISYSTDGVSWSAPTAVGSLTGQGCVMASNGTLYVAAGSNGAIFTSPDLATWTARTSGVTQFITDIKWLNSNFVALSNTSVVTSADGLTWTVRATGATRPLLRVTYGAGVYVAAGGDGAGNVLISSPNLTTWTPRNSLTTENLRGGITFSTSGFLLLGDTGVARISSDGLTWAASPSGTTEQFINATFNPSQQNVYYALTVGNKIRKGVRTLPTQFQVPNDDPTYGWVKAKA